MAASFAWLSVIVKRGLTVEQKSKIVKCNWEDSFGELLQKTNERFQTSTIEKVVICKNDRFIDVQEVSIDLPVFICKQFECKFICFMLKKDEQIAVSSNVGGRNAFEIMMNRSRELVLPPSSVEMDGKPLNGPLQIRNKVLEIIRNMNLGWTPDVVGSTGEKFVRVVADTLWTLDAHHKQFHDRACSLPSMFSDFQGFNDWQRKKQKKPQLSQDILEKHIALLSDYLLQPWFCNPRWQILRSAIDQLVGAMHKYKEYLDTHNEHMKQVHIQQSPIISPDESFSVTPIAASLEPTKSCYSNVHEALVNLEPYQPIFLNDYAPQDRYQRRHWVDSLSLQFPIVLYKFSHRASIGTMCFVWQTGEDMDHTKNSRVIAQITTDQSVYATRAMKRDFLDKYSHLAKIPKSVLRNIYKTLTGDSSSSSCSAKKDIDDRVIQALLDLDDPQIVLDMRELNGNPNSTRFDVFWDELAQYLEDTTMAVDERRHTSVMHMPIAISVRNLRDIIVERLQKKHSNLPPVPSLEWIRLQFWPSSPYANQLGFEIYWTLSS